VTEQSNQLVWLVRAIIWILLYRTYRGQRKQWPISRFGPVRRKLAPLLPQPTAGALLLCLLFITTVIASVIFSSTLLLLSLLPSSCSFGNYKLFNIICITTARKIICSSHGFFIHLFFMRQRDEKLWIDPCMLCQLYSKIRPMYQNGPSLQEVVNPINYPVKQNEKNKPVKITNHRRRHRHVRKCKQNELPDVHACTSKQQF
jgi:hypothetical protein